MYYLHVEGLGEWSSICELFPGGQGCRHSKALMAGGEECNSDGGGVWEAQETKVPACSTSLACDRHLLKAGPRRCKHFQRKNGRLVGSFLLKSLLEWALVLLRSSHYSAF